MESASFELMTALRTLLEIGKYSDLTIVCGQKEYQVHRAIICSRSGFFDGACSNPFREAETGIIDLSEDDPEAVDLMINYFYHLDYLPAPRTRSRVTSRASRISAPSSPIRERPMSPLSPMASPTSSTFGKAPQRFALVEDPLLATAASYPKPQCPLSPPESVFNFMGKAPKEDYFEQDYEPEIVEPADPEPDFSQARLITHARVYALAEKYDIRALKALAHRKFAIQSAYHWSSPELPAAIQEVYEGTVDTDRGLRDVVISTFRAYPEIAQRKDVADVIKQNATLAYELFCVGWGLPI
ncbi:hypothetical protein EJ08DRAFT_669916 [Tothia fuscella]|uniref:BTB domain-containing protein n=1 Tax=Tothia fuscella TaxID=1048955 RepID=A0A9P4U045_9PEZI|nr:hypothetical protein EJ08DRAFT_669916 [Tothia fuscella]